MADDQLGRQAQDQLTTHLDDKLKNHLEKIRADPRWNIFDIVARPQKNRLNIMFAGIKVGRMYRSTIMGKNFGRIINDDKNLYEQTLGISGVIWRVLKNRNHYKTPHQQYVARIDTFRVRYPRVFAASAATINYQAKCIELKTRRYYLNVDPPAVLPLENAIEKEIIAELARRYLPQPIAEEIADFTANTARLYNITPEDIKKYARVAIDAPIEQTPTEFHKDLVRYYAAEAEITARWPRAAVIFPPILTPDGYYAGEDMPSFEQIEEYLAARE